VEKVAVPVLHGAPCAHVGHSSQVALLEANPSEGTVACRQGLPGPAHEHGEVPARLNQHGTTVVLAGRAGPGALTLFAAHGIAVLTGETGDDPAVVVASWLSGTLTTGGSLCEQ